jgi:hypothetical protein
MILAIGLGLLGVFALRRAHRRCHAYGHGCHSYGYGYEGPGGYGWHGPWAPPWHGRGRRSWMMHAALARLDASPAQERAIIAEVDQLVDRVRAAKGTLKEGRGDLAAAIRGATLDDAALGGALGRVDATSAEIRRAAIEALRNIHGILDDKQRAALADLLDRGGWWRRGPYR